MNRLFFIFLVVAAAAASEPSEESCEPGSQFKDFCNTCVCSKDGKSSACTLMACDENVWNKDGSLKSGLETTTVMSETEQNEVCKTGSVVKQYCNTCTCGKNGILYACTLMACDEDIWNEDGSLKSIKESSTEINRFDFSATEEPKSKKVCKPGSLFNDYCNTCTCANDGSNYACTLMACDENIWNKDGSLRSKRESKSEQVCKPGELFQEYCNTCTCSEDGLTYGCTLMACDENVWNKDGTLKSDSEVTTGVTTEVTTNEPIQVCEPNAIFKLYCNTCRCAKDGTDQVCTRMACNENVWNEDGSLKSDLEATTEVTANEPKQLCEPNTVFKYYCNTCRCSEDGTAQVCTRMGCKENVWNKDGTKIVSQTTEEKKETENGKQICEPESTYMDYCNTCKCSKDGLTAACTLMSCDKNIFNRDGTIKIKTENHKEKRSSN